jgi:hypothetical protein
VAKMVRGTVQSSLQAYLCIILTTNHETLRVTMLDREDFEELTPGLNRYWLMQHQIVVYEATTAYRSVVDMWATSVAEVMEHWPINRPYLVIHDFRGDCKNYWFSANGLFHRCYLCYDLGSHFGNAPG